MMFWVGFAVGFIVAIAAVAFTMWYLIRLINKKGGVG